MEAKLNFLVYKVIEWFYLAVPLLSKRGFHLKSSKINSVEKPTEHIGILQIPSPVWALQNTRQRWNCSMLKTKTLICHIGEASTKPPVWSFIVVICCHCSKLESIIDLKVVSPPVFHIGLDTHKPARSPNHKRVPTDRCVQPSTMAMLHRWYSL